MQHDAHILWQVSKGLGAHCPLASQFIVFIVVLSENLKPILHVYVRLAVYVLPPVPLVVALFIGGTAGRQVLAVTQNTTLTYTSCHH